MFGVAFPRCWPDERLSWSYPTTWSDLPMSSKKRLWWDPDTIGIVMRWPVILSFEHWRGGTEIKLIGPDTFIKWWTWCSIDLMVALIISEIELQIRCQNHCKKSLFDSLLVKFSKRVMLSNTKKDEQRNLQRHCRGKYLSGWRELFPSFLHLYKSSLPRSEIFSCLLFSWIWDSDGLVQLLHPAIVMRCLTRQCQGANARQSVAGKAGMKGNIGE